MPQLQEEARGTQSLVEMSRRLIYSPLHCVGDLLDIVVHQGLDVLGGTPSWYTDPVEKVTEQACYLDKLDLIYN